MTTCWIGLVIEDLALGGDRRPIYRGEPSGRCGAPDQLEVAAPDLRGQWSDPALAQPVAVDLRDRLNFHVGAGEEELLGHVELGRVNLPLLYRDAQLGADADDRLAGDALQDGVGDAGCHEVTVADQEDVLARPFRALAGLVEQARE